MGVGGWGRDGSSATVPAFEVRWRHSRSNTIDPVFVARSLARSLARVVAKWLLQDRLLLAWLDKELPHQTRPPRATATDESTQASVTVSDRFLKSLPPHWCRKIFMSQKSLSFLCGLFLVSGICATDIAICAQHHIDVTYLYTHRIIRHKTSFNFLCNTHADTKWR